MDFFTKEALEKAEELPQSEVLRVKNLAKGAIELVRDEIGRADDSQIDNYSTFVVGQSYVRATREQILDMLLFFVDEYEHRDFEFEFEGDVNADLSDAQLEFRVRARKRAYEALIKKLVKGVS